MVGQSLGGSRYPSKSPNESNTKIVYGMKKIMFSQSNSLSAMVEAKPFGDTTYLLFEIETLKPRPGNV